MESVGLTDCVKYGKCVPGNLCYVALLTQKKKKTKKNRWNLCITWNFEIYLLHELFGHKYSNIVMQYWDMIMYTWYNDLYYYMYCFLQEKCAIETHVITNPKKAQF